MLAIVALVGSSACSSTQTQLTKPGATAEDFQRDLTVCKDSANRQEQATRVSQGGITGNIDSMVGALFSRGYVKDCMRGMGWREAQ